MEKEELLEKEVKVRQPTTDFNNLSETTNGKVEEANEDELKISLTEGLDFTVEDLIQIVYVDNVKGIYYFNAEVNLVEDSTFKLEPPEEIHRLQRRKYLRVNYETDIDFSPISYQGESLTHLEEKKGFGQMKDISAGGICFSSNIELLEGMVIELRFELREQKFQVLGEVVRSLEKEENYEMGIKFDLRSEKVENDISNFVLQQQIKSRRKQAKDGKEVKEE